ncbi:bifunctional Patatin-like phospholipase domain-containing protein/Acyl transferase-acyl hydrolase-lysophospholipase [Babesia duncani]|uniref:Bifunctional Patatin-like phospholipase domain-containing protein/Acyl transferase-acyl hydrolase-lysophospholipase n=1 Tax=Babesia duncani TaxID=323732 RepID=A0AAD9PKL1_9APIC|nr:bifunctional Patatin-like phospholipase domain-containing protein/Acyl transferase-acyl hydrolase-lysophospholipase [Babesia duncani]
MVRTQSSNPLLTFQSKCLDKSTSFHRQIKECMSHLTERIKLGEATDLRRDSDDTFNVFHGPKINLEPLDIDSERFSKGLKYFDSEKLKEHLQTCGLNVTPQDAYNHNYHLRRGLIWLNQIHAFNQSHRVLSSEPFRCQVIDMQVIEPAIRNHVAFDPFKCNFQIKMQPLANYQGYNNANYPSFRLLYMDLINCVNSVLLNLQNPNLQSHLERLIESGKLMDLFLAQPDAHKEYIVDILRDYESMGLIEIYKVSENVLDTFTNGYIVNVSQLPDQTQKNVNLGWCFSPCGFLVPYHLGILTFLCDYNIINMTVPLVGGSAGALAVAGAVTVSDYFTMFKQTEVLHKDAIVNGTRYRLDEMVTSHLNEHLPLDAHEDINNRIGTVTITWSSRKWFGFKGHFDSKFENWQELRDALRVSCNIPRFSTKEDIIFKGLKGYDGQFASKLSDMGCVSTCALRTIFVAPFPYFPSKVRGQDFKNDILNPLIDGRDCQFVHYILVKSLLRTLWERKLKLQANGETDKWVQEVNLYLDAYAKLQGMILPANSKCSCGSLSLKNPALNSADSKSSLPVEILELDTWHLFYSVVAAELVLKQTKGVVSAKNLAVPKPNVNALERLVKFKCKRIFGRYYCLTSPYTLADWLKGELEKSNLDLGTLEAQTLKKVAISCQDGSKFGSTEIVQSAKDQKQTELQMLKQMLHCLLPPPSLTYSFTEFPYLLQSCHDPINNFKMAINSSHITDVRHLFDIGKTDGFRWLISEYISLENWLYFRIKQLEAAEGGSLKRKHSFFKKTQTTEEDMAKIPLIDKENCLVHKQHKAINEITSLMNLKDVFESLRGNHISSSTLFKLQNRIVRQAITCNILPCRFTHILTLKHYWIPS